METIVFSLAWILLGVVMLGFVCTSGLDFGINLLLPFLGMNCGQRHKIMHTVDPVWEAHLTWLVLGIGALFALYPQVYGMMFSLHYGVAMGGLFFLMVRPVAFKFRAKDSVREMTWIKVLACGAAGGILCMGWMGASLWQGLPFKRVGFDWEKVPSVLTLTDYMWRGLVGVMLGLCMATYGCAYINLRTEEDIAHHSRRVYTFLLISVLGGLAGSFLFFQFMTLNSALHMSGLSYVLLGVAVVCLILSGISNAYKRDGITLVCWIMFWIFLFGGVGWSAYPFILPSSYKVAESLSIFDGSSLYSTTVILSIVAGVLPGVLGYTAWTYYVLRGRVSDKDIAEKGEY